MTIALAALSVVDNCAMGSAQHTLYVADAVIH